jgi:hypothetical protein
MTFTVTAPGFYDLAELDYHADTELAPELGRSLSVSGAKTLLRTPALFDYQRKHGRPPKDAFDVGTLAHELILRGGDKRIRVIDCYDWRTKASQEAKKAAHAEGMVPVSRADLLEASRMARAVRRHPLASAILSEGRPEVSFYWIDPDTGITCRGRVDWLRDNAIVDVKTCADASPEAFAKSCANFRYDMQADYYTDGIEAVTGRRLPFLFICVEKEPPHLLAVYQLDEEALERGHRDNAEARRIYAECESSGVWPGYSSDIELLSLPRWAK